MARLHYDDEIVMRQRQTLEAALASSSEGEAMFRKIIAKELQAARMALSRSAKEALGNDPRQAYKAVRYSVYKKVLGGNLNILRPRRAGTQKEWRPERKLDQNPNQRGGNRRKRSSETERMDGYWGKDRGFILRFVNNGVPKDRKTRYGRRGIIASRNWFDVNGQKEMTAVAERLGAIIDNELEKLFNNG